MKTVVGVYSIVYLHMRHGCAFSFQEEVRPVLSYIYHNGRRHLLLLYLGVKGFPRTSIDKDIDGRRLPYAFSC